MKIADVLSESGGNPTRFVYHGTSRAKLPAIARDGLLPHMSEPDEYSYDDEPYPRLWGTASFDQAREYAEFYPDPVILRFPEQVGQPWETDAWAPGLDRAVFTRRAIPASVIQVFGPNRRWYPLITPMTESVQPMNVSTELIRQYGGRAVKFKDLPATARKAIIVRGREHLDPNEPVPRMNPNQLFGYVEIPMEALKQAVFSNLIQHNPGSFKSFDDYHGWYVSHGDTPNHTEVWPIELETEYPEDGMIEDGSHRFHSYVRSGVQTVPVIYKVTR